MNLKKYEIHKELSNYFFSQEYYDFIGYMNLCFENMKIMKKLFVVNKIRK